MRYLGAAVSVGCACIVAVWAVRIDQWGGPSLAFALLFLGMMLILGAACFGSTRSKLSALIPASSLGVLLFVGLVDLSPVRPALRAVKEIRPGMTEIEVRAVVARHFPPTGRFRQPSTGPTSDGVMYYVLDPSGGRYNASLIHVRFRNGKCESAEFQPD